jgi:superfamily II DNA or RNA helicase
MTLLERLSRLTFKQAEKILGIKDAKKLILKGGKYPISIPDQVQYSSNVFRLTLDGTFVSIVEDDTAVNKMRLLCSDCETVCEHIGAAFSLILEEKTVLNLAKPPKENKIPLELTSEELTGKEIARRQERAVKERFTFTSAAPSKIWTDYVVTSEESGKTYRVALRGLEIGDNYCTCPDFRKNTLGTCKHILFIQNTITAKYPSAVQKRPFIPDIIAIHLRYAHDIQVCVQTPPTIDKNTLKLLQPFITKPVTDIHGLMNILNQLSISGIEYIIYPDAEEYLQMFFYCDSIKSLVDKIRKDPEKHPLRKNLLKAELLPYQLDGIAFVAGAGRAVLADDMGLGKTIQGIGVAEFLARYASIKRVLIVCPASVKTQWSIEIRRFCNRSSQMILGSTDDRFSQYHNDEFYTICNYEQILRDLEAIEKIKWDLIILDEGQRIKNWEAKTSQTIKALRSRFALVLSGTPLENRLDELYSVVEFIDNRRLGPDFFFQNQFRISDEKGMILGYKNLDTLRKMLRPVLLRRTRNSVMQQLPPRTTEIVRIIPTEEQLDIHGVNMRTIQMILDKPYISEMDLLRLQKALLICRMVADSTFLVTKTEPAFSSKLDQLKELLPRLASEDGRKIILFSEWTTMLDIIEKEILKPNKYSHVRLDGSVPQKMRQGLVNTFQNDDKCIFFIASNAGATGLNLQAANTIVNVDLPWNPAILEQRIGRAHRMGQKRPVQVYLMVTVGTIEEKMLTTLALKQDLSRAALDHESDVSTVGIKSGIEELKKRLEIIMAAKPVASIDESERTRVEEETKRLQQRKIVEKAGGDLLQSVFAFVGASLPSEVTIPDKAVEAVKTALEQCSTKEDDGSILIKFKLENNSAMENLAKSMAAFMAMLPDNTHH